MPSLSISALPNPTFTGANQSQAVDLRQIALVTPTRYQKASLTVVLTMSSGATTAVTSSCVYSIYATGTSNVSTIAAISNSVISPTGASSGVVDVIAVAFTLASSRLVFKINVDAPVTISSLSLTFVSTQTGVPGTTNSPSVNAVFSDGTQQPNLVSGGVVNMAGVLAFSSSQPSISAIDNSTGTAILWLNYYGTVTMTVSAIGTNVTATANYSCNLTPSVGDVDLGGSTGPPLATQKVNTTFTVPVTINIGSNTLSALQLSVTYNPAILTATSVAQGSGWPGGIFLTTLNDPPGTILIGGTPSSATGSITVAVISFTVIGGAGTLASISGTLTTFSNAAGNSIVTVPRTFVAGSVTLQIPSSRRRNSDIFLFDAIYPLPSVPLTHTRQRRGTCSTPPLGDTNGDCTFDLNDSVFAQNYVAQKLFNSTFGSTYSAAQNIALDADQNGIIDSLDPYLLARISFRLLNFVSKPIVNPVDTNYATNRLSILVNVFSLTGAPVTTQTVVYFDVESTNASFTPMFANTTFVVGSASNVSKGAGYNGGFWQAASLGNGSYLVDVYTGISLSNIGLSLVLATVDALNGTNNQRFAFYTGSQTPYTFSSAFTVNLPVGLGAAPVSSPSGYTPWIYFSNTINSSYAQQLSTCNPGCVNGSSIVVGVCNRTSQTSCQSCAICGPGTRMVSDCYNSVDRVCSTCDGITNYQNMSNQMSCLAIATCSAGQQQISAPTTSSDRICVPCTLGLTFKQNPGQATSCINVSHCQPGQMQVSAPTLSSDRTCASCTLGITYQPLMDQTACLATSICPPGQQLQTAATLTTDLVCIPCSLNYTFKATAGQTQGCISVKVCSAGQLESTPPTISSDRICTNCPIGTTNLNSDPLSTCTRCYAGSFMPAGSYGPCVPCPAGTTDSDSNPATACVSCSAGTYVPSNQTGTCASFKCPSGSTDADSNPTTACQICSQGSYTPVGSYSSCSSAICPAGTIDNDNSSSTPCVACQGGCYVPPGSYGNCISFLCPSGTSDVDNSSATACQSCGYGTFVPAGSTGSCSLYACAAGTTDDDLNPATACVPCGAGTFAATGSYGPCTSLNCSAGTIDDDSNSATPCIQCGAGSYIPTGSYGSCSQGFCAAGTTNFNYNPNTPCTPCGAGSYVPYNSAGPCSNFYCPAGFIDNDLDPTTPCILCPAGNYLPVGQSGSCSSFACPAGTTDLDSNSSTSCVACPRGSYSSASFSGSCIQCSAGTTDHDSDPSTPCVICSAGAYAPAGSFGSCASLACAYGTVDEDSNSSTPCITCDGTTHYQDQSGQTQCKYCLLASNCSTTQYLSGICTALSSPICSLCHPTCLTCTGPTSANCSSCSTGLNLQRGVCVSSCSLGSYANSSKVCSACSPPCVGCAGSALSCTICNNTAVTSTTLPQSSQTYLLNSTCTSTCDQIGYYKNNVANQTTSGQCISCSVCQYGTFAQLPCSSFSVCLMFDTL